MRSFDLRTKMTIGVSAVVTLLLSLGAFFGIAYVEKQFKANIGRHQFLLVSAIANDIDSKLLMAHRQLIAASRLVSPAALRDPDRGLQFLAGQRSLAEVFDNHIGLFTASGREIAEFPVTKGRRKGGDYSFRPYYRKTVATGQPVISDPYISSHSKRRAVMMTAPVMGPDGRMAGMLAGSIDLAGENFLGDIARIRIGREGYVSLTTSDRIMVVHPDQRRIMQPIPVGNRLYDEAVEGYEGTDETVTTAGIPMITSIKRMKVNGWMIVANYPQAEAYAPLKEMRQYVLAGCAAAVVGIFLAISLLIRRFTGPLARFTKHVEQLPLTQGAEKQIAPETGDEIGTLSRAFNAMVAELDRQQAALRESENLFRTLAEKSIVGIYLIQDGIFRYVNPRFSEIFRYGTEEIVDRLGPRDLMHPDDWPASQEYIRQRMNGEAKSVHYAFRGRAKTGEFRVIEVFGSATQYAGRPAIIGTLLDITERKQAEEALRESEERFRELADSLPQTVFEMDPKGRFLYVNRTALEVFGYTTEDLARGINVSEVIAPQDRERALENIKRMLAGGQEDHREYLALRRDGTTFPATVHAIPVVREGRIAGLRGIVVDMTDRKRLEAEVFRSQKLESLGVLAGGIAHDFNNILTGILGNISLARMRVKSGDPLSQNLQDAEKASLHARDLTQQLLTFARGGSPVKTAASLEQIVRDAASFALRGTNVRLALRFAGNVRPVQADAGQLGQVFHNLVINACQAMPEGGTITISAENCRIEGANLVPLPPGDYVHITVEDAGMGIPGEHLPRIFDPYFTTKQKGSGLGLTIAHSVIKGHGGHISVTSKLGEGSTFTLYLPATEGEQAQPAPEAAVVRGKGRVLVMDDEDVVRTVVSAMLAELGYEATVACDGAEAIRTYCDAKAAGLPFDAVIMDLTIPGGMGGKDAIGELRAIDPDVRAAVSSGYSDDQVMADFAAHGFAGVVKKPFDVAELGELLRRLIPIPEDQVPERTKGEVKK